LIVQAPDALRHSWASSSKAFSYARAILRESEKLTAELDVILANNVYPADMDAVHDRVTKLLRRIKEYRKQTGVQPVAKGGERR